MEDSVKKNSQRKEILIEVTEGMLTINIAYFLHLSSKVMDKELSYLKMEQNIKTLYGSLGW